MGFLVESLRQRKVEAFGVDISAYAIQHVHPSIQPYCWVGSISDPFPQKYGLVVCIEVLEHLDPGGAEQAISNICRHTDDVLFSSTPFDREEKTHFNVQPPEYWAELFGQNGFFRQVDFNASFITSWAARFQRMREPVGHLIAAYERRLWQLEQENQAYRKLCAEQDDQLVSHEQKSRKWETRWAVLEASIGWALLRRLQRWRSRLAPVGSKREQLLKATFRRVQTRK
jgi:hypothetical protein